MNPRRLFYAARNLGLYQGWLAAGCPPPMYLAVPQGLCVCRQQAYRIMKSGKKLHKAGWKPPVKSSKNPQGRPRVFYEYDVVGQFMVYSSVSSLMAKGKGQSRNAACAQISQLLNNDPLFRRSVGFTGKLPVNPTTVRNLFKDLSDHFAKLSKKDRL